jgi:MerR family transcriptional regulator, thiopeptide resistance regulator
MADSGAMDAKTVGAVAALTGASVRTLHHYDHIGLVIPSMRSAAGYRCYTDADVERLHLVLLYRAAGLPLDEIAVLLDDPHVDTLAHLRRQHELLHAQSVRLHDTITALEKLMAAHRSGIQLTAEDQIEIFGTTVFSGEYADEAQERWGNTDAWKQSRRRTAAFTRRHWQQIAADGDALLADLAQAKRDGVKPGSDRANILVRRHAAGIEQFYDCDPSMQIALAEMYLADERFTRHYDDVEPGLDQLRTRHHRRRGRHVDSGA